MVTEQNNNPWKSISRFSVFHAALYLNFRDSNEFFGVFVDLEHI